MTCLHGLRFYASNPTHGITWSRWLRAVRSFCNLPKILDFTLILPLVKMDNAAKRRRRSTGGSAAPQHGSYAGVTRIDVSSLSDSDKLNFLVNKMCVVETLVTEVHSLKMKLNSACCEIENLQISHTSMPEEHSSYKMRLMDLEARSRRQNLIFRNIPEPDEEFWEQCEIDLVSFIKDTMKLGDEANDIVFQRVHRLGKPKRGIAPNGQPWRPRPIIASFRDDKIKEKVLGLVGNIRVPLSGLAWITQPRFAPPGGACGKSTVTPARPRWPPK